LSPAESRTATVMAWTAMLPVELTTRVAAYGSPASMTPGARDTSEMVGDAAWAGEPAASPAVVSAMTLATSNGGYRRCRLMAELMEFMVIT
jgi:hypothetical protein